MRQDHEKDLQSAKQRLLQETQLREKEAAEFADRLKEVRSHTSQWVCRDAEPELRELALQTNQLFISAGSLLSFCTFPRERDG